MVKWTSLLNNSAIQPLTNLLQFWATSHFHWCPKLVTVVASSVLFWLPLLTSIFASTFMRCLTPLLHPLYVYILLLSPHTSNWLHVWSCRRRCSPSAPRSNTKSSSALTPLTKNSTKVLLTVIIQGTAKISFSTQFNLLSLKGSVIIIFLICLRIQLIILVI